MRRVVGIGLFFVVIILWLFKGGSTAIIPNNFEPKLPNGSDKINQDFVKVVNMKSIFDMESFIKPPVESDNSDVMMPYLGNQTQRAELGHSTWHFLHTLAARFPISPTDEQQKAVIEFIHLFSRLYPCGNCAGHFQLLLKEDPPSVSSRDELVYWFCRQHNKVNVRLKKPLFDCSTIYERWQCGCIEAK